jgi:hypothetical protein
MKGIDKIERTSKDALLLLKQKTKTSSELIERACHVTLTATLLISEYTSRRKKPDELLRAMLPGIQSEQIAKLVEGCQSSEERRFCYSALLYVSKLSELERRKIISEIISALNYANNIKIT